MNQYITDAINFAKSFAEAAPEGFEEVAFQSALQHFLSSNNYEQFQKPRKEKSDDQVYYLSSPKMHLVFKSVEI